MKSYLAFAVIPIFLLAAYFAGPMFTNNEGGAIPIINAIHLPNFQKSKSYQQTHINSLAFIHNRRRTKSHKTVAKTKAIHLSMIYFGKTDRFCKINGVIFREGDRHKNIKVITIKRDQVLISNGKKLLQLKLNVRVNENI